MRDINDFLSFQVINKMNPSTYSRTCICTICQWKTKSSDIRRTTNLYTRHLKIKHGITMSPDKITGMTIENRDGVKILKNDKLTAFDSNGDRIIKLE